MFEWFFCFLLASVNRWHLEKQLNSSHEYSIHISLAWLAWFGASSSEPSGSVVSMPSWSPAMLRFKFETHIITTSRMDDHCYFENKLHAREFNRCQHADDQKNAPLDCAKHRLSKNLIFDFYSKKHLSVMIDTGSLVKCEFQLTPQRSINKTKANTYIECDRSSNFVVLLIVVMADFEMLYSVCA